MGNFNLKPVSVADEIGLSVALLETPKTGFVAMRPIYNLYKEDVLLYTAPIIE